MLSHYSTFMHVQKLIVIKMKYFLPVLKLKLYAMHPNMSTHCLAHLVSAPVYRVRIILLLARFPIAETNRLDRSCSGQKINKVTVIIIYH